MLFTFEGIAVEIDEREAIDCLLSPGEMSLHHMAIAHGSPPNRSAERRKGYSITYLAPHVRHAGKRNSAMLVRGEDRFGHFVPDPVPEREMQPEICAFVDAPFGGARRCGRGPSARLKTSTGPTPADPAQRPPSNSR
jgi:non-heme Fe2+,alpha-ketoglutarate-dependent halogenase